MINSKWVSIEERMPREDETINGRVPILDPDGYLCYAVLVTPADGDGPWFMCDFDVKYWLPVPQLEN